MAAAPPSCARILRTMRTSRGLSRRLPPRSGRSHCWSTMPRRSSRMRSARSMPDASIVSSPSTCARRCFLSEAFAAQARDGTDASIVNILDQRVFKPTPHFVSYTLAKSALHAATRMLAQALAPKVRVNAVAPGPTMASARQSADDFARQAASVPLGRGPSAEEIAAAVAYLSGRAQRDRRDARGRRRAAPRVGNARREHRRMNAVASSDDVDFDSEVPVLIVGAGAAGLCAALTLSEAGIEPVVIERDAVPCGSTALSAGLIPAAGTRFQRERGIADSPKTFAAGYFAQGAWRGRCEAGARRGERRRSAGRMARGLLRDAVRGHHRLQLSGPFGASHARVAEPHRRRADRPAARAAAEARDIPIFTGRVAETLFADEDGFIEGIEILRRAARPSAAARWCSPATAMAAMPSWCGSTFPRWPTRFTSAIPAIRATRCCGARRSARGLHRSPAIRGTARSRRRTTS